MKLTYLFGMLIAVMYFSCGNPVTSSESGSYSGKLTIETQTHQYAGEYPDGSIRYSWVNSSSSSYTFSFNPGSSVPVNYPGTITTADLGNGTFQMTFNEIGSVCGIANLSVTVTPGGGMVYTGYAGNNCGRSRIGISITLP